MQHLAALQFLVVLHSTDHSKVDGVLVFRTGCERGPENYLIGSNAVHRKWIAQRKFVLRECTRLVGAKNVYPGQFLDG